jgi:4-hydroxybenzoate polyprenyltransferase
MMKSPLGIRILDCFFLLRIPLLAPVWTIFFVGWITGNKNIHPFCYNSIHGNPYFLWLSLGGFSLIVASIYVVNQIADIESDRINHKLFLLPHGYVSIPGAWTLAIICGCAGLATACFFDHIMILLFVASLLLGFFYNLPPFQLKNRACGGVIANILGHGILTFLVGWHAGQFPNVDIATSMKQGFVSSLSPGMAIAAVFLATTIPDAAGDRLTKKITFCIRYGEKKTALVSAFCCAAALISSFFMAYHFWVMAIPSIASLFLFIWLAKAANKNAAFQAFK